MSSTTMGSDSGLDVNNPMTSWLEQLASNPKVVITFAVVILAIVGGGVAYTSHESARSATANNALYEAQTALNNDMKTWQAQLPKGEDVQFQKVDADSKFGDAIKKFQAVSDQYAGTRGSFEAEMALADLYFNHGDAAKALPYYEKAVKSAPKSFDRANALSALGYARENSGNIAGALDAYEQALKTGEASLKGDLLLSVARCHELLKQPEQAKSSYEQILKELPNTDVAKKAELLKAKL